MVAVRGCWDGKRGGGGGDGDNGGDLSEDGTFPRRPAGRTEAPRQEVGQGPRGGKVTGVAVHAAGGTVGAPRAGLGQPWAQGHVHCSCRRSCWRVPQRVGVVGSASGECRCHGGDLSACRMDGGGLPGSSEGFRCSGQSSGSHLSNLPLWPHRVGGGAEAIIKQP